MDRHDRQKDKLVSRFVRLDAKQRACSTSAARSARSCSTCARRTACALTGVDFKDLSANPSLAGVDFRCGLFYEQDFGDEALRPDHDVALPRARLRSDAHAAHGARLLAPTGDCHRGAAARQHDVPPVRRPLARASGAAAHGALRPRARSSRRSKRRARGRRVSAVRRVPGVLLFLHRRGVQAAARQGTQLSRAIYPYFLGQILFSPILAFEKQLNFAMQTVVCRRRS